MRFSGRIRWTILWVLLGSVSVAAGACDSSNDSSPGGSLNRTLEQGTEPGLVITDLVCQLDGPTLTAAAIGSIESRLAVDLFDVAAIATWVDADNEVISSHSGATVDRLIAGETVLFAIRGLMQDEMAACRLDVASAYPVPVTGEVQAKAEHTSELAK